jgi:hypothetical protein
MRCAHCGADSHPTARFCASCGTAVTAAGSGTAVAAAGFGAVAPFVARGAAFSGPPPHLVVRCPRCFVPAVPAPYFSRGINIAKAVALMIPFNVMGPLLFFLLRKDRFICGACRKLLSGEASVPMLQGFSGNAGWLAGMPGAGGAVATYDPDQDLAVIEGKRQRQLRRAWTWGGISAVLAGIGGMVALTGQVGNMAGYFIVATPPGLLAVLAAVRGRTLGQLAATKHARQQRQRVLELARARLGRLNVSYVATELRIELADADRLLGSMVDGYRVEMEVDDAGRITYVFAELQ